MNEKRYPGGKGTFYQRIINLMPPHRFYIETHVGGGAIMRHKRPAEVNIAIDPDPKVKERWASGKYMHVTFYQTYALKYLDGVRPASDILIYCDPPYMAGSRKGGRVYSFEYTDQDHIALLSKIKTMAPCMIIISGYDTELYQTELADWNNLSFEVRTRGGNAIEHLWYNFEHPRELHDYAFLGDTFRDRERIKRKRKRWIDRIAKMGALERRAMLQAIRLNFKEDFY